MTGAETIAYRAFLSYSHRDTRWGKRLHRALEGLRIDKDIVGRETAAGPVPDTLRPIFRDREDFTAGESLNDQTIAALEASRFLVVICSPAAADSRYVDEEVRRFKAVGRADRVIPVIVDGAPGQGDRECFPPAVRLEVDADGALTDRPTELLAADVRETGDGWNLALAKVAARLMGLATDEVYRRAERDRRRRGRIRFGVAAAMLALVVVGGVFGWRDHEKQRTLAEVETLVVRYTPAGDAGAGPGLRQSLTEAITAIAQGAASDPRYRRALNLLKAHKLAEAEPLLKAVAEDKKKLAAKQGKEAAEAFRNLAAIAHVSDPASARKYYAEAASLDPEHVEGLLWHGWMQKEAGELDDAEAAFRRVIKEGEDFYWHYWARLGRGDLKVARGDLKGAKTELEEARKLVRSLAASDPGNAGWQRDLSASHDRVGDVLVTEGSLAQALKSYRASMAIREHLAETDAGNATWQRDLSVSHIKIGDVLRAQGDLAQALESCRSSLAIAERLAEADAGNAGWQRDLSVSHIKIGDMLVAQGNLVPALQAYRASLAIAQRLADTDPGNAGWQRDLSVAHERIGGVLRAQGDLAQALESYRASLAIAERLAEADAGNAGWQRDLYVSFFRIADIEQTQGNLDGALKSIQDAHAIMERLTSADPDNAGWQMDLAYSHNKVGDVLVAQGDLGEALQNYRASLAFRERLARTDPGNAKWQRDLSVSHERIGDVLVEQGHLAPALESYRASLAIRERLAETDAGNAGWQHDVAISYSKIGLVAAESSERDKALAAFRRGLGIMQRLKALASDHAWFRDDHDWFEARIAEWGK